jgi:Uncharacterised nucleotidyltransferase
MIAETETDPAVQVQHPIDLLSRVLFHAYFGGFEEPRSDLNSIQAELEAIASLDGKARGEFIDLANKHHVIVRTLSLLKGEHFQPDWYEEVVAAERARTAHALMFLDTICQALESHGCKVAVIKSLDHWPDLGSDLDLYTTAREQTVEAVMWHQFHATPAERSWGDRLAHKWNFHVPGLPELVEIHVRYLGQTGEHNKMAHRVIERRVMKTLAGRKFFVPAPEERIVISTLQRMYRHFYFRLCDMTDVAALLQRNEVDFAELRRAADVGGIWPGVASFLSLVANYVRSNGGIMELPEEFLKSDYSRNLQVHFEDGFLRVPKLPAAGLYGAQLLTAGRNLDVRAMFRLPLLPPLAVSALVAMHLTGSDKGVW